MSGKQKGIRRVMIRPFLAELLGLNVRQVSKLFNGPDHRVRVHLVREYILQHGIVAPIKRQETDEE